MRINRCKRGRQKGKRAEINHTRNEKHKEKKKSRIKISRN